MEQKDLPSPLITHLSWGKMTVEGIGPGKDFKLWPRDYPEFIKLILFQICL